MNPGVDILTTYRLRKVLHPDSIMSGRIAFDDLP